MSLSSAASPSDDAFAAEPRRRWRGVREAVALVWSTGPRSTMLLAFFSLVQAVLPFLSFYATKRLLDAVAGAVREPGSERAAEDAVIFAAAAIEKI